MLKLNKRSLMIKVIKKYLKIFYFDNKKSLNDHYKFQTFFFRFSKWIVYFLYFNVLLNKIREILFKTNKKLFCLKKINLYKMKIFKTNSSDYIKSYYRYTKIIKKNLGIFLFKIKNISFFFQKIKYYFFLYLSKYNKLVLDSIIKVEKKKYKINIKNQFLKKKTNIFQPEKLIFFPFKIFQIMKISIPYKLGNINIDKDSLIFFFRSIKKASVYRKISFKNNIFDIKIFTTKPIFLGLELRRKIYILQLLYNQLCYFSVIFLSFIKIYNFLKKKLSNYIFIKLLGYLNKKNLFLHYFSFFSYKKIEFRKNFLKYIYLFFFTLLEKRHCYNLYNYLTNLTN